MNALQQYLATYRGRAWNAVGWSKARRLHIQAFPACYVCGYTPRRGTNDVHHIVPRHVAPDLIDAPWNLVTLCGKYKHHLWAGHLGNYRSKWNPDILAIFAGTAVRLARSEEMVRELMATYGT